MQKRKENVAKVAKDEKPILVHSADDLAFFDKKLREILEEKNKSLDFWGQHLSDFNAGKHSASTEENAASSVDQTTITTTVENLKKEIVHIETNLLVRIKNKSFGICKTSGCGNLITKTILEASKYHAEKCWHCLQEENEKNPRKKK